MIMSKCRHSFGDMCKKDAYPCAYSEACFDPEELKPKTNADRIRSMTDVEFARHIVNTTRACGMCPAFKSCEIKYPNFTACMNVVADWLKQPYKENA